MSFVLGNANAQDCHLVIKGKVIDQHDGKPLKGAIIAIYGLEKKYFQMKMETLSYKDYAMVFMKLKFLTLTVGLNLFL